MGNLLKQITFGNPCDIATNATEEVKGKKIEKVASFLKGCKKGGKWLFFMKFAQMSRVGSRDRHS